ncbi:MULTISPECIES: glycosyltransferase [unclassified Novosphingobium]|uniref:glycosyltransferase n=1 Tax=unclassified Novosphingobium TaxID=2644732 RepID=UPI0026009A77|nr:MULTISPECIES: glycosyltransferase [unclassified Novosphingobium]HQV02578.1 glycosyltransferase [Novosphingobium sp.]
MGKPKVLYISYDGMLEPLGQSQVIAYLERLATDYAIHLVSYEKPADRAQANKVTAVQARLDTAGIVWHPLAYHKTPTLPATLFDIAQGTAVALWLATRHKIGLVHARSYIPALIGWVVKLLTGAKLLFDMRGLWADERTDGGIWPDGGGIFRAVKRLEKTLLLGADHVVTLTHASKAVIEDFPYLREADHAPISVIPTCADLDRFTPGDNGEDRPFTLGYLGSIGTWYMFDEVLACFKLLRERRPDARLLVVNRNEQNLVRRMVAEAGLPEDCIEITVADHAEVPAQVRRMSAGAAIIKPVFSKIASAPTKLAEYLGCGVPCLGNVGVGDMELILETEGTGVALREFTLEERSRAVDRLLAMAADPATPDHCRKVALAHFSVEDGATRYRAIYRELLP